MEKKSVLKKILKFWFRRHGKGQGLEQKIGYVFREPSLLAHALIHRSWLSGKNLPYWENNERLEFLGDSVLNMLVTEYLYKTYPESSEGELSKRKSAIVSGHALAQTSLLWDLGSYIRIAKGEARMGGRLKESILSDAFEAVLGAVFLDGAELGDGCVVAANAVVTKKFPANAVIGGVPARILKMRDET